MTECMGILFLAVCTPMIASSEHNRTEPHDHHLGVVKWKFYESSTQLTVTIFLLAMILIKIGFHRIPYLPEYMPESLLLIILGVLFGAVITRAINVDIYQNGAWELSPSLFFNYLLPPIILEASYALYNRTFAEYLEVVLSFAVIGTIINFFIIGFGMFGLYKAGAFGSSEIEFNLICFLLFSALIVAVDPVAVLAIFQDVGVDLGLYFIIFGESLLNDAVTIVLYDIISALTGKSLLTAHEIGIGIAAFLTVSLGGFIVGIIVGILSCLLTRIKSQLGGLVLIILAYFSYIIADMVGWSGIISMIGCGLMQAAYAFHNLNHSSVILVHKLTAMVAEMSESVVFLFIGIAIFREQLEWHTGFILWSLILCIASRTAVIFTITAVVNRLKVSKSKISMTDQIILIYGGLRGAMAFCLAVLIDPLKLGQYGLHTRRIIITATLFIIVFTVGFMGMTIKPLVKLLKIRLQSARKLSLFEVVMEKMMDELLAGLEGLTHLHGRNSMRGLFQRLDERLFRKVLQREPQTHEHKLLKVYEKIALQIHYATMQPQRMHDLLAELPETLKKDFMTSKKLDLTIEPIEPRETTVARRMSVAIEGAMRRISMAEAEGKKTPAAELAQLGDYLWSPRRLSLQRDGRCLLDYNETFCHVMKSKNRAIKQRLLTVPQQGLANLAFVSEAEEHSDLIGNIESGSDGDAQLTELSTSRRSSYQYSAMRRASMCAEVLANELTHVSEN